MILRLPFVFFINEIIVKENYYFSSPLGLSVQFETDLRDVFGYSKSLDSIFLKDYSLRLLKKMKFKK